LLKRHRGIGPISYRQSLEERVKSSKVRQVLLGLTAFVFTAIALGSLVAPRKMAEGLGYSLDSVDALSEFRAVYVGLWLATAALLVVALRRVREAILGDLCATLVIGQTVGRIVSLLLDGTPSGRVWPIFVLEAIGGVALLVVRPSEPTSAA
jgi:uncharacterized protein DUF4345